MNTSLVYHLFLGPRAESKDPGVPFAVDLEGKGFDGVGLMIGALKGELMFGFESKASSRFGTNLNPFELSSNFVSTPETAGI